MSLHYHWRRIIWSRRFQIIRLILTISLTILYFHGLLYSSGAVNTTVPNTNTLLQKMSSTKSIKEGEGSSIHVLRSLPHLRVINTLHRYQQYQTTIQTKNHKGDINKPLQTKSSTTDSPHTPNSSKSESESYILAPILSFILFTMIWRLILTILIYQIQKLKLKTTNPNFITRVYLWFRSRHRWSKKAKRDKLGTDLVCYLNF